MRIQTWTSRNIIELVMLVLLNINKWAWIILDSGMFVLVLHSLKRIICPTKENDWIITFFLMLLIMLFLLEHLAWLDGMRRHLTMYGHLR